MRIALANLRYPSTPRESVTLAQEAITQAAAQEAELICFPECYIPGYRAAGKQLPTPDSAFLEDAWDRVAMTARASGLLTVLGTERVTEMGLLATALVIDGNGTRLGFQDKVQIDPSEEATYVSGAVRQVFRMGPLTFGIVICHEGWRYPETVRWSVRNGAQIVFHPQFHEAGPNGLSPSVYADPRNTFHEKAVLCRAAENTCYFATVNYASAGSPTTSAIARPDGTLLVAQPYGQEGLLIADIDLGTATGLLAHRLRTTQDSAAR
ncbi:MAG: carbon-nitrogen hydrolase family protein [Terriglobales bacterium]